jgi:hypothetical protein
MRHWKPRQQWRGFVVSAIPMLAVNRAMAVFLGLA